ncbi:winged helix-turn-helix domain-containing protein [Herbaspirillum sp. WKF16]|uniref:winged helix-turn-helix domain-containing protein n=1 Tax=Herbaspirillum sp. WKF16 TaxID=3028312 RepID=UPI0023A9DF03|nr:winged helix-turn-helix domain-containing protein [Herbaspirillum sp. WKF16]WDZ95621.1 winged helix-turn-helix domain-containing protein [Herbaspirillum sp. WKF16]
MKTGILTSSADCAALLRQLPAGRDCAIYAGAEGLQAAREDGVGLLVVDLDGLETLAAQAEAGLRALRMQAAPAPAVLLLAAAGQKALLRTLRAVADDYLLKPIRRNELALRLELLLHAADPQAAAARVVEAGGFLFDLDRLRVSSPRRPGLDAALTQKEAELALLLLQNLGRPLSRAFLQERIWGAEPELPTRTIDTHVSRVRTKLGLQPGFGYRLATVYGYGYQLELVGAEGKPAQAE